jgi:hypothetical protein
MFAYDFGEAVGDGLTFVEPCEFCLPFCEPCPRGVGLTFAFGVGVGVGVSSSVLFRNPIPGPVVGVALGPYAFGSCAIASAVQSDRPTTAIMVNLSRFILVFIKVGVFDF